VIYKYINVNSILQNKNTINKLSEETISKKLFHINSLSNQSILLVQDIIHYVSGNSPLKIKKEVIDLKEVILLSNNILLTLIECDEIKLKKITPFLKIDEKIDDLVVRSDENLLKQILVNFITNAVKFTKDGNIKLKAEYIYDRSIVEISVKDTGIGIREKEKKSLFRLMEVL
jgi:signal transduction histidine kinase